MRRFIYFSRINLNKLDGFGYRDFSEAALDLVGRMIRPTQSLQRLPVHFFRELLYVDNSADHASYLKLRDSLRAQGLYQRCNL